MNDKMAYTFRPPNNNNNNKLRKSSMLEINTHKGSNEKRIERSTKKESEHDFALTVTNYNMPIWISVNNRICYKQ